MLNSKVDHLFSFLKTKKILIGTHDLADLDGYASSIALKYILIHHFNIYDVSVFFSEFSRSTNQFIEKIKKIFPNFDFSYEKVDDVSDFDIMLIIDTNGTNLVKLNGKEKIPFICIDHHVELDEKNEQCLEKYNLILSDYSSTAEIIFNICEIYDIILPRALKLLIISAILTDSGFFKYGNNQTIFKISKLLDNELNIQDIFMLLKNDEDISKKIAKIKGMQRVKIIREGDYLIGLSHVSNFEASVANALLTLGFDISIVLSEKQNDYRITARATSELCLKKGLNLGKLLGELSSLSIGNAGGHAGAASLNGKKNQEKVLEAIIEKVKEIIIN